MREFQAILRGLRQKAGLTQKQLAEKAGLAHNSITQFESGLRQPSWSSLVKLSQALGLTLGDWDPAHPQE